MIENPSRSASMEHRGIVGAPLFPRRDPAAAYVTLDEALSSGLRSRETSESGTVLERLLEELRALRQETAADRAPRSRARAAGRPRAHAVQLTRPSPAR